MTKVKGRIKSLSRLVWFVVIWLCLLLIVTAISRAATTPTCSLSQSSSGLGITDSLSGLKPKLAVNEWYIAILNGPGAQQIDYFKPTAEGTGLVVFPNASPGGYVGGLFTTVDNNKGPAKFTQLATVCGLTL